GAVDPEALRAHLRTRVPDDMVPDAIVPLDTLPHTPTGKLDLKTLPLPVVVTSTPGPSSDTPKNFIEVQLIHIWEDLLGREVSPVQNFFALGGNSLLALRLFAQIKSRLNCELSVAVLFTNATVREMARVIAKHSHAAPALS